MFLDHFYTVSSSLPVNFRSVSCQLPVRFLPTSGPYIRSSLCFSHVPSEDSDDEAIVVHPLPWRSDYVNQMFQKIDDYSNSKKSPQARRQMKERIYGRPSNRPRVEAPEWAVRKT